MTGWSNVVRAVTSEVFPAFTPPVTMMLHRLRTAAAMSAAVTGASGDPDLVAPVRVDVLDIGIAQVSGERPETVTANPLSRQPLGGLAVLATGWMSSAGGTDLHGQLLGREDRGTGHDDLCAERPGSARC
jgi:hypothetical protein